MSAWVRLADPKAAVACSSPRREASTARSASVRARRAYRRASKHSNPKARVRKDTSVIRRAASRGARIRTSLASSKATGSEERTCPVVCALPLLG